MLKVIGNTSREVLMSSAALLRISNICSEELTVDGWINYFTPGQHVWEIGTRLVHKHKPVELQVCTAARFRFLDDKDERWYTIIYSFDTMDVSALCEEQGLRMFSLEN